MTSATHCVGVALLLCSGLGLFGTQDDVPPLTNPTPMQKSRLDRTRLLSENTHKLKVLVTMDRREYFPGEAAQISISITNPTPTALEVYEPFRAENGQMEVLRKKLEREQVIGWEMLNQDAYGQLRSDKSPTRMFAAGETMERKFASFDDAFGHKMPSISMPSVSGEYKLIFGYGGEGVDFRIVPAQLERVEFVALEKEDPAIPFGPGRVVRRPRDARVAVVSALNMHHIVISRFGRSGDKRMATDPDGRLSIDSARALGPYLRVISSTQAIVSLQGVADSREQVTLTWTTADGRTSTLKLDPDRNPVK